MYSYGLAVAAEPLPSWPERIWGFVSTASNLVFLWQVAVAMATASTVVSTLPGGWHPPQYWLVAGSVFFVTWAIAATITSGFRAAVPRIRRWMHPSSVTMTPDSGKKASITILHSGEPTRITVEGRIVSMLNGSENPAPQRFDGYLLKGTGHHRALTLAADEWVQVVLAEVKMNEFHGNTWLSVERGVSTGINAPDAGVLMDITVRGKPALPSGPQVRRYRVVRTEKWHITVTEESIE